MIYKTLKKVSDVCQLLDKSKYPATQTINGVTFTNNGDGSITVNGTATSTAFFLLFKYSDSLMPKHKYLLSGSPNNASANAYIQCYDDTNWEWLTDKGGGGIAIFPKQVVNPRGATNIRIRIEGGYTANNLTFKPQLFDLTEMYGARNEPTTVEQFRQDFPEELYDYKPYCFAKSYKNCLTCTTKNLFDSEGWYNTLHAINSTSMVKETVNGIEYYKFRPQGIYNYEYMKGEFKENTIYTLSCLGMNADGTNNRYSGFQVYYTDGTRSLFYINTGEEQKYTVTTSSNKTIDYIILGYNVSNYVLVRNIQLEEGSTATEYQPYGYIQSYKKSFKVTNSILL